MKQNLITKLFCTKLAILLVCCLSWNSTVTAQTLPQSGTCFFVGETIVGGVNTKDTLPAINVGLAPGTCTALVTVPKPPLNVAGCASIQQNSSGPAVDASEVGCSFTPWGCNTCFGCQVQTTTTVVGPPTFPVPPPATPPPGVCATTHVGVPAALVVSNNCTATFGAAAYTLQIAANAGGPYTNLAPPIILGNGNQVYTLPVAGPLYTVGNNFIRPSTAWGTTSFGEGKPTFQLKTFGAYVACVDSNMTPGATLDTFTAVGGKYYRVFRSIAANCQLVRAVLPINVLDLEPPTFVPACPKGGVVSLNAGPGECEVSWDAPQFMAMDNCPTTGSVSGGGLRIQGCASTGRFASVEGLASGIMFDLRNPGSSSVAVVGLASWFCHSAPPTMVPDANYQFWIKNTANTAWRPGVTGAIAGPGGCQSGAFWPLSQWTLAATTATHKAVPNGIRLGDANISARTWVLFGANATNNDTMDLRSAQVTQRVICGVTMSDTSLGTALILAPGEIRGCLIAGAPGTGNSIWANDFNACGGPNGNATLTINPTGSGGIYITNNNAAQIGGAFNCASFGFSGDIFVAGGSGGANMIVPVQYCGQPYSPGCFFPIGCTKLCYRATDVQGNVATCEFNVCVNAYANPTLALACQNDVQLSLDPNCLITLNPSMFLSGGPYKCYNNYVVEARLWSTTGTGGLIDRLPGTPGVQLNGSDIGHELKITVRDPATGNSCWSHATVEDKIAPRLTCPPNITVACAAGTSPSVTGTPTVVENCSGYSLTYRDNASQGSCPLGYSQRVIRTWTAVDASNNKATCVQLITVGIGDIFDVTVPPNWDNIQNPMLACNQKIDRNKDVSPHMADYPECVDGYLLDSVFWRANPLQPNIYPNRRIPRILGWNCIDDVTDPKFGHPASDPVYYPQHRQWSATNPLCWGPNERIEWYGTGKPGGVDCFNFAVTCEDVVFNLATPGCDAGPVGCYKILRKWTVVEWCTSTIGGHNQIIKVADPEGPEVLYPDSSRVNMESYSCFGRWEVPPAWIVDNCSTEIHYSVEVEDGTVLGNETSGYVVVNMPEGIQIGYIVATDCCGNITKKRVVLNVIDRVPPQAICRTSTVVGINGNQSPGENIAKVCAESFDEGSYDNCAPHVFFKVIRMAELLGTNNGSNANNTVACNGINGDDNLILPGNQVYFDDCTYFCCADVNNSVMVVLRVFDVDPGAGPVTPTRMTSTTSVLNGRFSDCMIEVTVQNKAVPTVVAPPNIVVSCSFWFDIANLTNPNDPTFGRVVTDLTARKKVVTSDIVCHKFCERNQRTQYPGYVVTNVIPKPAPNQACDYYNTYFDTAHWDRKYDLVWGFDGYVIGACGATPTISVNDLRECGQGQIQRVISTIGPNNLNVSAIQTIWVVDCDPFYIDTLTCNDARFTDLLWPNGICTQTPVTVEGCGGDVSPDNPQLGRPQVINNADDNCALLSIEYKDEIFTIEPDACFKILRTWTVIDWCQYDPFIDPNFGRWSKLQVIKVRDKNKPVVTCTVGPCEPATISTKLGVCVGHIALNAEATDNCSPIDWLLWDYKIDLYNDGKGIHGGYDYFVGSLTRKAYAAGDTVEYSHNPYADDNHNPFDASGTYPLGIHKICWFVEDGCGNIGVCCTLFEIKDCKAPTPYCLTGVITVPMPSSGCIDVWAKDLDHGSFDNCTSKDNLKFYFDGDPNKPSIRICCDDFVTAQQNDELRVDVEMWVEDEEGNKDYCKTIVIIQDNLDICPNTGSAGKIVGELKTNKGDLTNPVDVKLMNNGNITKEAIGSPYSFGDLELKSYVVKPTRNDDHINGVSTLDITLIQKHILGKVSINNPYLLIAADVNNSGTITSADISEIRKLILGTIPEFTKVQSWTFVPTAYVFPDVTNPWNAPRDGNVSLTVPRETKTLPFVAIKMGDVSENARASNFGSTSTRTNGKLSIEIDENTLVAGETYKVNFKSSDFVNVNGYQFTLKFDASALTFEGTEAGVLNTDASNFGLNRISNGIITTSWNANTALSFGKDDVLFTLVFKASKNAKLSQSFNINSDVTAAEAYVASEVASVKLGVRTDRGVVTSEVFELYQNEPNPFNKSTVISYRLPEAGAVKLTIYDVTGKVVRVYDVKGQKGLNTYNVNKSDLNASGVLYYQLDAANNTATKRMVIIE
ncbi:MAG: HYR domain-containing protein [Saprospiraceae bacterium]